MNSITKRLLILAFWLFAYITTEAQLRLPNIIASNMVLQRGKKVPVWGWAAPGKTVSVNFAGQEKKAFADEKGYWRIELSPMKAISEPQTMLIKSDTSGITLTNILVGEVWLASGQSNMEYWMKLQKNFKKPFQGIDSAELELSVHTKEVRIFKVEKKLSGTDVPTIYGWQEGASPALDEFSAPAYYFAKHLNNILHIPVGIISSSWGGSYIEPWTPADGYVGFPSFAKQMAADTFKIDGIKPGQYYEKMIKPIAPFAIKGFLWYQGESNCMKKDALYAEKMQVLTTSWRKKWADNSLPFYSVLIGPWLYTKRKAAIVANEQTLPEFWEQQMASLQIPNTEIINVSDLIDDVTDIHPSYKWIVGRRLANLALAKIYGDKEIIYSGPRFKKMKVKGNTAIVTFSNDEGLKTSDGKAPDNFLISGDDGNFLPAKAEIFDNKITLTNPGISKVANVRFAWKETAMPNLVNASNLPAFPFRTDAWKWKYVKR